MYYSFCALNTHFFIPNSHFTRRGCSPWTKLLMLWAAESEDPNITTCTVIYYWLAQTMTTVPQRHKQTDRQRNRRTDDLSWQYRAASRSKMLPVRPVGLPVQQPTSIVDCTHPKQMTSTTYTCQNHVIISVASCVVEDPQPRARLRLMTAEMRLSTMTRYDAYNVHVHLYKLSTAIKYRTYQAHWRSNKGVPAQYTSTSGVCCITKRQ